MSFSDVSVKFICLMSLSNVGDIQSMVKKCFCVTGGECLLWLHVWHSEGSPQVETTQLVILLV